MCLCDRVSACLSFACVCVVWCRLAAGPVLPPSPVSTRPTHHAHAGADPGLEATPHDQARARTRGPGRATVGRRRRQGRLCGRALSPGQGPHALRGCSARHASGPRASSPRRYSLVPCPDALCHIRPDPHSRPVCVCVCARVRACVRACVHMHVYAAHTCIHAYMQTCTHTHTHAHTHIDTDIRTYIHTHTHT